MFEMMLTGIPKPPLTWQGTLMPRPTWSDQATAFGMCAGWEDGDIFIAGGNGTAGSTKSFSKYNVNTGVSSQLPNYPGPETLYLRLWTYNNKVYALLRDQFHSYNPATNLWTKLTSYPYGNALNQYGVSVNVYQGVAYFFGCSADTAAARVLYRHNVANDTLAVIKNWGTTYTPAFYAFGAINNGVMYTLRASAAQAGVITRTSLDGNTISTIPIPTALGVLGFAVAKNDWVYFGGTTSANRRKVWRYNVVTDEIQEMPDLPVPFNNGGFALVGGNLYIYGGTDATNKPTQKDMWRYDLPND